MPQQLIYTSAPRGLIAGRSGHCTVARSASMRESLMLRLEQLSYYHHLSLGGGRERPIFAYRIVDIRGSRFHVLSRIQDAGLDFTGRTNFIAHHLALTPEELAKFPTPPVILRDWPGWAKSWTKEPQSLENEDWASLAALAGKTCVPAQTWLRVTGDAVNGYGLLETRAGVAFRVDDQTDETVLGLFAESVELLEVKDARRDFRTAAWQYTFTTSMQEQDNPADFRWRCIHADNPASSKFAGTDCRPLSSVRATKWTGEETAFARTGRQSPRFVTEPQDIQITEGEAARLQVEAAGVPDPSYQWFSVDRAGNGQVLTGETGLELVISNPALGVSRYCVRASNSAGDVTSKVATLSVEQKARTQRATARPRTSSVSVQSSEQAAQEFEKLNQRIDAGVVTEKRKSFPWITIIIGALAVAAVVVGIKKWKRPPAGDSTSRDSAGAVGVIGRQRAASKPDKKSNDQSSATTSSLPPAATPPAATASKPTPPQMAKSKENLDEPKPNPERPAGSLLPPATGAPLPTGWTAIPIGGQVKDFSAEYINVEPPNKYVLTAAAAGFSTNGDQFLFVHETNPNEEFIADISIALPSPKSGCGIMARESLDPGSPFIFIGISMQKIVAYRRDSERKMFTNEFLIPKNKQNAPVRKVRFKQEDNQYVAAYSDSENWFPVQDCAIPKSDQMFVGFAIYSGNPSAKVSAHFVNGASEANPPKQK